MAADLNFAVCVSVCVSFRKDFARSALRASTERLDGLRSPFGRRAVRQRGYGLRLSTFKMTNNEVDRKKRINLSFTADS